MWTLTALDRDVTILPAIPTIPVFPLPDAGCTLGSVNTLKAIVGATYHTTSLPGAVTMSVQIFCMMAISVTVMTVLVDWCTLVLPSSDIISAKIH